jgi:hypothetical protein
MILNRLEDMRHPLAHQFKTRSAESLAAGSVIGGFKESVCAKQSHRLHIPQIRVRRVAIHTDRQSIGSNDHRLRFLSLQRQLRNAECLVVVVPYRIALLVSCQAQSRTVSSEFVHLLRCASRISCGARSKPDGMPCWGKSTPCIKRLRILPAQRRTSLLG